MSFKWRCGYVAAATLLLAAILRVGLTVQLSFSGREDNTVELTCAARTTVLEGWTFWIDDPNSTVLSPHRVDAQSDLSITISVILTPENEGYYYCGLHGEISNPVGPFTANPHFTKHTVVSVYRVIEDGASVLLPNPVPLPTGNTSQYYNITWMNGTSFVVDTSSSKYSLDQNGSLVVNNVKQTDSGQYSLQINVTNPITNSFFVYMNSSYRIYVQDFSRITNGPENITRFGAGGPESISCQATGYPNISIQWSHNGRTIEETDAKYETSVVLGMANTISSKLTVRTLNETDNGNVTCSAHISGCDVESYSGCVSSSFPSYESSFISVFTTSFTYQVIVLEGGNLELRISQKGSLIPQLVRVYIRYINVEEINQEIEMTSTQISMDLVILLYISRNRIPYEKFRIKVALGTSTTNSGLYKAPERDRIIDVNRVDNQCNITPWLALIIVAAIVCVTVLPTIVLISVACCALQKRKHKYEMKKQLAPYLPKENLDSLLREYFPKCYSNVTLDSDSPSDGTVMRPIPPGQSKLKTWTEHTDTLLLGIPDKNVKRALITVLTNTIKTQEWHQEAAQP